jgi:hypothetical protein
MLTAGDIERSDEVFKALGEKLASAYHPAEFSIRAFIEACGWVRNGPPEYVKFTGTFVMAEVRPSNASPYRFMIQREDALDADSHENVLAFIKRHDFSEFERTDGKSYYYQFIPQLGEGPGQTKKWEAGKLGQDIATFVSAGATSSGTVPS